MHRRLSVGVAALLVLSLAACYASPIEPVLPDDRDGTPRAEIADLRSDPLYREVGAMLSRDRISAADRELLTSAIELMEASRKGEPR